MAGERERRELPQCQALHGGAVRRHAATGSGNIGPAEGAGQEEVGRYWLLWRLSGVRPFATVACQAPLSVGILQARILAWVAVSFSGGSSDSENEPRSALQAEFFFFFLPPEPPGFAAEWSEIRGCGAWKSELKKQPL